MCLIIYAPKGQVVPREVLSYSAAQNDDGIGVMSSDGIRKFLGKKALKRARRYVEDLCEAAIPYAIHMRWATHGAISLANTHPYQTAAGDHWVMHNGIIHLTTAESSEAESDTAVYVRKFMADPPDFEDKQYYEQTGRHIGWGNKLVVMDSDARFVICNEDAGVWIGGVWYSNTYSLPQSFIPRTTYSGVGYYGRTNSAGGGDYDGDRSGYKTPYQLGERYDYHTKSWYNPQTQNVVEVTYTDGTVTYRIEAKTTKPKVIELDATRVERMGNKDFPNIPLLPRATSPAKVWPNEDMVAYYEALEAGLTETEAQEYLDPGHNVEPVEPGELAALREQQGRALAAVLEASEKPEAPPGGDFPEHGQEIPIELEVPDNEDEPNWRKYMRAVAATVHV